MPTPGTQVPVAATQAVVLVQAGQHAQVVFFRNAGVTNSVYFGDSNVTGPSGANPGYELPPGIQTPVIQLDPEESIWAICDTGKSTRVDVFQSYSA